MRATLNSQPQSPKDSIQSQLPKRLSSSDEDLSEERYQNVLQKIYLQSEFIYKKIPQAFVKAFVQSLHHYLQKRGWPISLFVEGSEKLKFSLHLVVFCPHGKQAYKQAFRNLPFSLRGAGLPRYGVASSFLGSEEDIHNYLNNKPIPKTLSLDLKIPIQKITREKNQLEFLSHQKKDLSDYSLLMVFDTPTGDYTHQIKSLFPKHALLSYIPHNSNHENFLKSQQAAQQNIPTQLKEEKNSLYFLPNLSSFYPGALRQSAPLFGLLAMIAQLAPEYRNKSWGLEGGPEGILKALIARYGYKTTYTHEEIAHALNWAEKHKSKRL